MHFAFLDEKQMIDDEKPPRKSNATRSSPSLFKTMSISSFTDDFIVTASEVSASPVSLLITPSPKNYSSVSPVDHISQSSSSKEAIRRRRNIARHVTDSSGRHALKSVSTIQEITDAGNDYDNSKELILSWRKTVPVYILITMTAMSIQIWTPMLPFLLKDLNGGQIEVIDLAL